MHFAPALLRRVQMEYLEMPGLRLTYDQAPRLWNPDGAECRRILTALVEEKFLATAGDGSYFRRTSGPVRVQQVGPRL